MYSASVLQRNVRKENLDNAEEQKRIKGNTLAYGVKIQVNVSNPSSHIKNLVVICCIHTGFIPC